MKEENIAILETGIKTIQQEMKDISNRVAGASLLKTMRLGDDVITTAKYFVEHYTQSQLTQIFSVIYLEREESVRQEFMSLYNIVTSSQDKYNMIVESAYQRLEDILLEMFHFSYRNSLDQTNNLNMVKQLEKELEAFHNVKNCMQEDRLFFQNDVDYLMKSEALSASDKLQLLPYIAKYNVAIYQTEYEQPVVAMDEVEPELTIEVEKVIPATEDLPSYQYHYQKIIGVNYAAKFFEIAKQSSLELFPYLLPASNLPNFYKIMEQLTILFGNEIVTCQTLVEECDSQQEISQLQSEIAMLDEKLRYLNYYLERQASETFDSEPRPSIYMIQDQGKIDVVQELLVMAEHNPAFESFYQAFQEGTMTDAIQHTRFLDSDILSDIHQIKQDDMRFFYQPLTPYYTALIMGCRDTLFDQNLKERLENRCKALKPYLSFLKQSLTEQEFQLNLLKINQETDQYILKALSNLKEEEVQHGRKK